MGCEHVSGLTPDRPYRLRRKQSVNIQKNHNYLTPNREFGVLWSLFPAPGQMETFALATFFD
jgi:hypothetical protein